MTFYLIHRTFRAPWTRRISDSKRAAKTVARLAHLLLVFLTSLKGFVEARFYKNPFHPSSFDERD